MSLNTTPSSERIHIGFFGRRNAGKSSLMNAVTGQDLAVVSETEGTTTDPVRKAMELLPLGPVVMIDTPGIDDIGELGELRVKKTEAILKEVNLAVVVADIGTGLLEEDEKLIARLEQLKIPYIIAMNKVDLQEGRENEEMPWAETTSVGTKETVASKSREEKILYVSAHTGYQLNRLKEKIAELGKKQITEKKIVADLLEPGDVVVLVVPIDEAAPKGRLILPQQQTIRDLLDAGAISVVCKDTELADTLEKLGVKPKMVITDSQAFAKVSAIVPKDVLLTSFSILFARYKGNLDTLVSGAKVLDSLRDGDKILMAEGCTHHRQCGDIGSVKIPALIRNYTGKNIEIVLCSGNDFPEDLDEYVLVIHCGGCTLTEQMMQRRLKHCKENGVPVTNYGMAIAHMNGILARSMEPFSTSDRNEK
ncbi:MAG: [Lachnospiraceae bacterium]|nr:[FeFe] hydrogenase H-cluster maturation GTPase HydF [Lachnospiraceae bacterium]